jgi:FHIPEP family protein/type III secretion system-like peptide-binding chaperone
LKRELRLSAVAVRVELGDALSVLLPELQSALSTTAAELDRHLQSMGVLRKVDLEIVSVHSDQRVSVQVGEHPKRTPSATAAFAWSVLDSAGQPYLPWLGSPIDPGLSDELLEALVSHRVSSEVISQFLQAVVVETFKDDLAGVVDDELAEAFLEAAPSTPTSARSTSPRLVRAVLEWLLNMDVQIADRALILDSLDLSTQAERSPDDCAEAVYRLLRSSSIELVAHPDYLRTLLRGSQVEPPIAATDIRLDDSVRADHLGFVAAIRSARGIEMPVVNFVASTDLKPGVIGVRINERLVERPGLAPGELFVLEKADRLMVRGVDARAWPSPSTGTIGAAVPPGADRVELAKRYAVWDELGVAHLILYAEVERRAARLMAIDITEGCMSRLKEDFPRLVSSLEELFSIGDLTRMLRGVLDEGLSIADLQGIMERALLFDTLRVEDDGASVYDDRLLLSERGQGLPTSGQLLEFVRHGLRDQITQRFTEGLGALIVYRVDAASDAALLSGGGAAASELSTSLRSTLRTAGDRYRPVVMTHDVARPYVRAAIATELPQLPVVAESEVNRGVTLAVINREGGPVEVQEALLKGQVGNLLAEVVGPGLQVDSDGDLTFEIRSTRLYVRVRGLAGDRAIVSVFSITNRHVPPTPELYHWVATQAGAYIFGHIAAEELEGGVNIVVRHTLLGNFLDARELFEAVAAVSHLAEEVSADVAKQFGGELFAVNVGQTEAQPSSGAQAPP